MSRHDRPIRHPRDKPIKGRPCDALAGLVDCSNAGRRQAGDPNVIETRYQDIIRDLIADRDKRLHQTRGDDIILANKRIRARR